MESIEQVSGSQARVWVLTLNHLGCGLNSLPWRGQETLGKMVSLNNCTCEMGWCSTALIALLIGFNDTVPVPGELSNDSGWESPIFIAGGP